MARQAKNWIQKNFKLEVGIAKKLQKLHNHFDGRFSEVLIVENAIDSYAATILPPDGKAEKKNKTASVKLQSKK